MDFMTILKVILLVISWLFDKNKADKKRKGEALKQIVDGIEKEDASMITAGFDKVNR